MADSRIKDVSGTVVAVDIPALLNTLYLAVDDATFTEAKKILLKTLLTEAVIDADTNNYQAMTPKAFYDSIMTTTRKGIGQLATDGEVTAKTGTGLLNSVHQALMQAQWKKDLFVNNGANAGAVWMNTDSLSTAMAMINHIAYYGTVDANGISITPALPAGRYFKNNVVEILINWSSTVTRGYYYILAGATGVQVDISLGNGFSLYSYDGGASVGLYSPSGTKTNVSIAGTIRSLMK